MLKTYRKRDPIILNSVSDLKKAPYNPRLILDDAATGLSNSIKRFGDISGIVWNSRTGHLVSGHQRVDMLKKAGAKLKDGVFFLGAKTFPIRIVNWKLSTEKAANISANNPHIGGKFKEDDLNTLLLEIQESLPDFDALGLDALLPPEPINFEEEWDGMPEFDQKDVTAFRSINVHFKDQEAVDEFNRMVISNITDKTKYIWFPEIEIEKHADKEYSE